MATSVTEDGSRETLRQAASISRRTSASAAAGGCARPGATGSAASRIDSALVPWIFVADRRNFSNLSDRILTRWMPIRPTGGGSIHVAWRSKFGSRAGATKTRTEHPHPGPRARRPGDRTFAVRPHPAASGRAGRPRGRRLARGHQPRPPRHRSATANRAGGAFGVAGDRPRLCGRCFHELRRVHCPRGCRRAVDEELADHRPRRTDRLLEFPGHGRPRPLRSCVFPTGLAHRRFRSGDYLFGRLQRAPTVVAALPIRGPDAIISGVIATGIDLEWIGRLGDALTGRKGISALLIDGSGVVLARDPGSENWVGRRFADAPLVKAMLASPSGTITTAGLDGTRRIFGFLQVPGTNARIAVGLDEHEVLGRIDRAMWFA